MAPTEIHCSSLTARANATKSDAQAQEIARLRTSLEDARRVNSLRPPPNATATADAKRLQQLKDEHTKALAAVQQALGAEKSAADGLRVKLAAAEAHERGLGRWTRAAVAQLACPEDIDPALALSRLRCVEGVCIPGGTGLPLPLGQPDVCAARVAALLRASMPLQRWRDWLEKQKK